MIEYLFFGLKAIFFFVGIIFLSKGLRTAFCFLIVPVLIAGAELVTDQKKPWHFLFSGEATQDDIIKAIAGGIVLVIILVIAGYLVGSQLKSRNETA